MSRLAIAVVLSSTGLAAAEPADSLSWQLRPVTIDNVVRVDSGVSAYHDANGNIDLAVPTVMAISYRISEHWAPMLRLGVLADNAPGAVNDHTSFVNPMVGLTYARRTGEYRAALFGGTTLPVGTATYAAAVGARPADSAMFEVDHLTQVVGAGAAYVNRGFTAQVEASASQGMRVRGDTERFRSSAAVGMHLGYVIAARVSLGGDLRYQHWFSGPAMMPADTVSATVGARLHLKRIQPGISYTRGMDTWAHAIQLDVPVAF